MCFAKESKLIRDQVKIYKAFVDVRSYSKIVFTGFRKGMRIARSEGR